ncbi:MAG: type II secretion system GspH family protein [Rickettsiales bacterium]|jgi:type II secretory pathway pseudopilin PulG|nr:type II secretion system GspH family protein [Rickettsiales bacterium]
MRYRQDSGRSIVEMLGVLAIMGVITVMGISGYSQAVGRINRNKMVEDIVSLAQEVRTLYAGQNLYDDEIQANVIGVKGIDPSLPTPLPNPFGGAYTVELAGTETNGRSPFFKITADNISQADCTSFRTMTWMDARKLTGEDNEGKAIVNGDESGSCSAGSANTITLVYQ